MSTGNFNQKTVNVFYIEKKNNEYEDISYLKCINNLVDYTYEIFELHTGTKEYMI